jgi:hypothetical protein
MLIRSAVQPLSRAPPHDVQCRLKKAVPTPWVITTDAPTTASTTALGTLGTVLHHHLYRTRYDTMGKKPSTKADDFYENDCHGRNAPKTEAQFEKVYEQSNGAAVSVDTVSIFGEFFFGALTRPHLSPSIGGMLPLVPATAPTVPIVSATFCAPPI